MHRLSSTQLLLAAFELFLAAALLSTASGQDSRNARRPFECYGLCLSNCFAAKLDSDNSKTCINKCQQYAGNNLCNSSSCWDTCKDLSSDEIKTTSALRTANVSASFVDLNPRLVGVQWDFVPGAIAYLVVWKDADNDFGVWNITDQSVLPGNRNSFQFSKPNLCSMFNFSVIAFSRNNTIGSWSKDATIGVPLPIADKQTAYQKVVSLRNETRGIVAVVEFGMPQGWSADDILATNAQTNVHDCQQYQGLIPQPIRIPGTFQYEIVMPHVDFIKKNCDWFMAMDQVTSRCGTTASYYEHPNSAENTDSHAASTGVAFIRISCDTVEGFSCAPSCPEFECRQTLVGSSAKIVSKKDSACNNTVIEVSWDDRNLTLQRPQCTVQQFMIGVSKLIPTGNDFIPKRDFITSSVVGSQNRTWRSSNLDGNSTFGVTVCAIYQTGQHAIQWDIIDVLPELNNKDQCSKAQQMFKIDQILKILLPILAVAIIAAVIVAGVCTWKQRKQKAVLDKMADDGYFEKRGNEYVFIERPNVKEKWELDRERLILYADEKPLGSGAFGKVFKGKVQGKILTHKDSQSALAPVQEELRDALVAVKQCFEYADALMKSEFRQEIELMKQLGYHPHLVNMLHCIMDTEPLCLIVEFCENGDLRKYLRENRNYMLTLERMGVDYASQETQDEIDDSRILCIKDLVLFSFQISDGLEYLHQKGYIHRDIAARNVLVDKNNICKIGDFGLCRFVNNDPIYLSKGGKVPIKWMALESLKEFRFTFENDVWAFGVLLFEIITLGGTPYPDILPADGDFQRAMIDYLESGKRMEQPDNCPDDVYMMMQECWRIFPNERPNISSIRERLRKILETIAKERDDMYLDPNRSYYNVQDAWDEEPQVTADMLLNGDVGEVQTEFEQTKLDSGDDSGCFVNRNFTASESTETPSFSRKSAVPAPPIPPKSTNLALSNSYLLTPPEFRKVRGSENSCESGIGMDWEESSDSPVTESAVKPPAKSVSGHRTAELFGLPPALPSFDESVHL